MTAQRIADLLQARRSGPGRWMARCPAHSDGSPSLSIREGQDGRVLLHCFAGCALTEILAALGLAKRDLFTGAPRSQAECKRSSPDQTARESENLARKRTERAAADRIRKLGAVVDSLAARLALMPAGQNGESMTRLYHATLAQLRAAEAELEVRP
jgi:hypothetical protein